MNPRAAQGQVKVGLHLWLFGNLRALLEGFECLSVLNCNREGKVGANVTYRTLPHVLTRNLYFIVE